jgi:cystathionine gamma-synthase
LNPISRHYQNLKRTWEETYEDHCWTEDAIFLERNSRDFVRRIDRINENAEAICDLLRSHPKSECSILIENPPMDMWMSS